DLLVSVRSQLPPRVVVRELDHDATVSAGVDDIRFADAVADVERGGMGGDLAGDLDDVARRRGRSCGHVVLAGREHHEHTDRDRAGHHRYSTHRVAFGSAGRGIRHLRTRYTVRSFARCGSRRLSCWPLAPARSTRRRHPGSARSPAWRAITTAAIRSRRP